MTSLGRDVPTWALPLIVAALVAPALAGLVLAGTAVGVVVALATLGVLVVVAEQAKPEIEVTEPQVVGADPRVLVVLLRDLDGGDDASRIAGEANDAGAHLVVPARDSALDHWLSATDEAREAADRRLTAALGALRSAGADVSGEVGDANPIRCVEDAVGAQPVSSVLFVTGDAEDRRHVDEVADRLPRAVRVLGD